MASKRSKQSESISNDGKDSEDIFEKATLRAGYAAFRLRDKRDLHGLNHRSVAAFGQPSDYIIVGQRHAFLAEVKSSHEKISVPFSCFTAAQRSAMAQCHGVGAGKNYRIYIHNLLEDKWYFTTADTIVPAIKAGQKSIKWSNLNVLGEI